MGNLRLTSILGLVAASAATLAADFQVIQKFKIGGEGGWDYISIDPAAHRLYISRGTRVQVMDTDNGKLVGEVANTPGVHGIAIAARLHKGFTSNGRDGTVTVFDLSTLKELGHVPVGEGPDAIVYDPSTQRVFTMNGRGGDATAVDARTNTVVGHVKLGGRPEFAAVDGRGHVYVNLEDKSQIQEIDAHNLTVLRTWSLAPGEGPSGLSIDPRRGLLFSTCDNNILAVSSIREGKVVATPHIGNGPDAAGCDPSLGLAFSSNGEGTLTIVKEGEGAPTVVQDVKTQPSARTMALDPRRHLIYLIAAEFEPAAPGENQRRRRMVAGSTEILVVGEK